MTSRPAVLPSTPPSAANYRLVGATLVDGSGAEPVLDAEIEVGSGCVAYAGHRRGSNPPSHLPTVDLTGCTVLPGFIDCHVHFGLDSCVAPAVADAEFPSERVLRIARNIERTLHAGITTARDLGGIDGGYRAAIAVGRLRGPRLHIAIGVLSPTGGHADPHLPNGRLGPLDLRGGIDTLVDSDHDVRRAVRELIRAGADVIKVCTTGGISSPMDTPADLGLPERHLRIICAETQHRGGQPVAAHAQGIAGIMEAISGGAASIEHGHEINERAVELMLARGTFLVPTLSAALRMPERGTVPEYVYEKKRRWSGIVPERHALAFAAGVRVALGTDAGICAHGANLEELGHMVKLGMSPMSAIVAGTSAAAELLRLDQHVGSLEIGKVADLVVTDIDPLRNIVALGDPGHVRAVVQGGHVVKDQDGRFQSLHEGIA